MLDEGYRNYRKSKYDREGREMVVMGERILRSEIPNLFREDYDEYLSLWNMYKLFGSLPFAGGWAEQPAHVTDALMVFEEAYRQWEKDRGS